MDKNTSLVLLAKAQGDFADWPKLRQDVQFISGKSTVIGLVKNQILVLEDGVEQPDVTLQQADNAASICLLLDQSSSMKERGKEVIEAARRLIATANPGDEFALMSFSGPVYVEQGFTTDTKKLDAALQRAEFKGASDVFDAVLASVVQMETHVPKYRKVIVILSDGDDNYSQVTLSDLLRRLRYPGAPLIYSLSPPQGLKVNVRQNGQALSNLLALTKATGGFSFEPDTSDELRDYAAEISRDIRSRYSLQYTSTHTQIDGKLHKVEIKIAPGVSASKIKPHFRQEYYAPSH
ncbi:VWA domain-containing protein [Edaphobacter bradus]|uniref:VWA domain-containing protein n=1 Tax=Edaphobacter bradus TaxID=2259016 RepID=UPI0021E09B1C|nr:VWA domain-containing protein [Edaphobacter bradus]